MPALLSPRLVLRIPWSQVSHLRKPILQSPSAAARLHLSGASLESSFPWPESPAPEGLPGTGRPGSTATRSTSHPLLKAESSAPR